jgi:5-methylthioadenosine/S-adenosylhomocysteine deaminase
VERIDLLISARWIIPIEPANTVLEDHSLAIHHGRIVAVLPTPEAIARYSPAEHIQRPSSVVLPGFVNAHTHAGMTLLRGTAENLPFESWLKERVWSLEQRWLDPEFVRDGAELAIAGMVASGTTCFSEQYFFPEVIAQTAAKMHVRACVGAPVIDMQTAWAASADECLDKAFSLRDEYRDDPLIAIALAPHAPYSLSDTAFNRMRKAVDEIEMPVTMHLHESALEVREERPLTRIERLGFLTQQFSGVHMTQLNDDDIDIVARTSMNVIHCPQSNLKLGNGICPVAKLAAHGVTVALGTDGAASNNDLDMLDEMRTAALLAGPTLSAHDWLRIATLNGAKTIGLSESIGSLTRGKWADVCCIDLGDVHMQPIFDPATVVVYAANRSNVRDVWIAGRQLVNDGALTRYDTTAIITRTQAWQRRIAATL